MKLYCNPASPNSRRPRMVAHMLDLHVEEKVLDFAQGEHRKAEFLKVNPNGMVPALEDGGFTLWESCAIMQYLCSQKPGNTLWPETDAKARADISRWQFWTLAHLGAPINTLISQNIFVP